MDKSARMTPEEFDRQLHKLGELQGNTIELARLILVEGKTNAEAARLTDNHRQNVSKKMQRVKALLSGYPASWVPFQGMMPESMAVEIRARIKQLLEDRDHVIDRDDVIRRVGMTPNKR